MKLLWCLFVYVNICVFISAYCLTAGREKNEQAIWPHSVYSQAHKTVAPQRLVNVYVNSCTVSVRVRLDEKEHRVLVCSTVSSQTCDWYFFPCGYEWCLKKKSGVISGWEAFFTSSATKETRTQCFLYILYSGASLFPHHNKSIRDRERGKTAFRERPRHRAAVCVFPRASSYSRRIFAETPQMMRHCLL